MSNTFEMHVQKRDNVRRSNNVGHLELTQSDQSNLHENESDIASQAPSSVNTQQTSSSKSSTKKVNKPKVTAFRQQKLPAWQPVPTARSVIPAIFIIGIVFLPIGGVLLAATKSVIEYETEYTDCQTPKCFLTINVSQEMTGNVYFYYGLDNYFQNHRRYIKSRNDDQLLGHLSKTTDCDPYDKDPVTNKSYAPCGAVANSMFNDTFTLSLNSIQVPFTYEGVIWHVDKNNKFKNPESPNGNLCEAFANYSKPANWIKSPCELDPTNPNNNGFRNVDFIVWMRAAALPNFRKLYRILDRNQKTIFSNGLPIGEYSLVIDNNYPVKDFNGRKYFIISTVSWAGGYNLFLGIAFLIVAGICIIVGIGLLIIHLNFGHSLKELGNITDRPCTN
uniref:Cell cycle control protein 50A n=1 Tax=Strongyloides papillosus TaxID=174720 RepID=A0A0N5BC26_STREA